MRFATTLFTVLLALGVSAQSPNCVPCCNNCKELFADGTEERTNCHEPCDSYRCGGYPGNCEALELEGKLN